MLYWSELNKFIYLILFNFLNMFKKKKLYIYISFFNFHLLIYLFTYLLIYLIIYLIIY